ncbi:hypothetical protein [Aerosakkonema funiforme]|uniref:hypothetical protein n=1 Tax=Aerosakkonema funiforme TaxID=1246630 RepID=UPI0035B8243F
MTNQKFKIPNLKFIEPLDRVAITVMLVLTALIGLLLFQGDGSAPRVRDFNWQDKQIGVEDNRFILTFNRPMNHTSVEENLQITPPLPGKFSWAGRKMAYTLIAPAPYGTEYQVQLLGAKDRFASSPEKGTPIQPFTSKFRTRDRAFVYLGVEGSEAGRLMLVNLSAREPKPIALTPPDLLVSDFKPYPDSDRILFSASDRRSPGQAALEQNIYTVTTGINPQSPGSQATNREPAGKIRLILDNKEYQNLKFDLSPDGKTIVVQRVNQRNPGDFGIWIVKMEQSDRPIAKPLQGQPGGDFLITPDSKALAIAQAEGLAIVPLEAPQDKPLDFLPKFGTVASFSRDGTQAAMVKFNTDYTRSLYLVTNQGIEKELLRITGTILSAQFDPTGQTLYCLLTKLISGEQYQEQPYIVAINVKTSEMKPLLVLPNQRQVQISLSPDGIALLFDQPATTPIPVGQQSDAPRTDSGEAVTSSSIWLLPVISAAPTEATPAQMQPEQLPLPGFRPRWLP